MKHPFTAQIVAEIFIQEVVRLYGFSTTIVSNCDKVFMVFFGKSYSKLKELHTNLVQHVTHKLMEQQKW